VELKIQTHKDITTALAKDTISLKKQAIVFCSSKRAAESQAEKVAKTIKHDVLIELSQKILNTLPTPTKQCKRLSACILKGIAFHHAGLAGKQRELIEDHFRAGDIAIICSTPTLAAGLDMPAFRAIIRDTKRFGARGMQSIPVLEYEQMSGRAGRPGKEDYGEAIIIANKEGDIEHYTEKYINGEVEDIYSKLAVEPVLRTYVLSLVATGFIKNTTELYEFFDNTFYAHQYGDTQKLHAILDRMINISTS
jgi:helicase